MTLKMDKLAEAGFTERIPDRNDRRIIRIVLTPEGRNFIKNSQKTVKESLTQLLSPLSFEEVEELKKSITTIKNVVLKIQDRKKR
jgi:DNA-binding MarR family transcriptional regulator